MVWGYVPNLDGYSLHPPGINDIVNVISRYFNLISLLLGFNCDSDQFLSKFEVNRLSNKYMSLTQLFLNIRRN